jgi:hypothetical protein
MLLFKALQWKYATEPREAQRPRQLELARARDTNAQSRRYT